MWLAEGQVLAPVLSAVMLTTGVRQQLRPGTLGNGIGKSFGGRLTWKYVILRAFFLTQNASRNVLLVALKLHRFFSPMPGAAGWTSRIKLSGGDGAGDNYRIIWVLKELQEIVWSNPCSVLDKIQSQRNCAGPCLRKLQKLQEEDFTTWAFILVLETQFPHIFFY